MPLPRLQLVELMDLSFWPRSWRRFMTDYLSFVSDRAGLFTGAVPLLVDALERTGSKRIVDLCSGSGGPWGSVAPSMFEATPLEAIELTDLHPTGEYGGLESVSGRIQYLEESVDALHVPEARSGLRTIWNGYHHFAPRDATQMLRDAVERGEGIAIFEGVERRPISIVALLLFVPWIVLAITPLLRPVRVSRLFWTYLVPVLPAAIAFDGIVSSLRAYTTAELDEMARAADPEGRFQWRSGVVRTKESAPAVTWLVGTPARR